MACRDLRGGDLPDTDAGSIYPRPLFAQLLTPWVSGRPRTSLRHLILRETLWEEVRWYTCFPWGLEYQSLQFATQNASWVVQDDLFKTGGY